MITLAGQPLLTEGHATLRVGPLSRRSQTARAGDARGVVALDLGLQGRPLAIDAEAFADDDATLDRAVQAVESRVDGVARELIDDVGASWPAVVVTAVSRGPRGPLGPRRRCTLSIELLQLTPGGDA